MASPSKMPLLSWRRDDDRYLISTDSSLIPLDTLNDDIFGSEDFTWGKSLPTKQLQTLLRQSLCFALYDLAPAPSPSQASPSQSAQATSPRLIGFARLITDLTTVHYLTDVFLLSAYRSRGLGVWMMHCIDEVFTSTEHLRGMILIVDRGSTNEAFYRKYLSMGEIAGDGYCMDRKGKGA